MISPSDFQELASGRKRGIGASALRAMLAAAAVPYGAAVAWRNQQYDLGRRAAHRAAAPVVSVGNLTVGGVGKTPLVEWIARRLRARGARPSILSRGYGAKQGTSNDEALELELALPGIIQLQNPDRCAAAERAVQQLGATALLLDDGFQHRRLARELDIVLLDASQPFGYGRLLPRGALRESPSGLARAHVVVLSRADMLDAAGREEVRRRAAALAPAAVWCEAVHAPTRLIAADRSSRNLAILKDQRVVAFCGIGNPAGFRHTLATVGCRVEQFREFPDHHAYTVDDARRLAQWARAAGASAMLCTRKDLVKLSADELDNTPLYALEIGLNFESGQREIENAVDLATEISQEYRGPDSAAA